LAGEGEPAASGDAAAAEAPVDTPADAPADAPPPAEDGEAAADGAQPPPAEDGGAAADSAPLTELAEDHAKAALKIQSMQRAKAAGQEVEKLKADGNLPGQVRARKIEEWGTTVFHQLDVNGDGKLSAKEFASALNQLPKVKPKKVPPGTKFQSVEEMMTVMEADAEGSMDLSGWLNNLHKCGGLYAALEENLNAKGELKNFKPEDFGEDHQKAVLKIQAIQRGRQVWYGCEKSPANQP
jgi:hypothetical protein